MLSISTEIFRRLWNIGFPLCFPSFASHLWHLGRKLCSLTARIVSAKTVWLGFARLDSTRSNYFPPRPCANENAYIYTYICTYAYICIRICICICIWSLIESVRSKLDAAWATRFRIACVFATKYVPDRPAAALRSPSITVSCPIRFKLCSCSLVVSSLAKSSSLQRLGYREREELSHTRYAMCSIRESAESKSLGSWRRTARRFPATFRHFHVSWNSITLNFLFISYLSKLSRHFNLTS